MVAISFAVGQEMIGFIIFYKQIESKTLTDLKLAQIESNLN